MSSSNWQKIEEIFDAAADLPRGERENFLNKVCGGGDGLRREVEALLAADEQSDDFIESPIIASHTLAGFLPDNTKIRFRRIFGASASAHMNWRANSVAAEWARFFRRAAPTRNFARKSPSNSSSAGWIRILFSNAFATNGRF